MTLSLFILLALLAVIPAAIAERKGGSFLQWWIFGLVLLIVAIPMALMRPDDHYGECPRCREGMRLDATVCPHCQRKVSPVVVAR